jgi:DNA-binding NarL/FixJ family response regulator
MLPTEFRNSIAAVHQENLTDSYHALVSVAQKFWTRKGVFEARRNEVMTDTIEALSRKVPTQRTTLTPKEKAVLRHLMEGIPNKLIGNALGISEATVKVHVKSILRVMGVDNRTQAALYGRPFLGEGE